MFEMVPGQDAGLFNSHATLESCDIAILPVPWDATTSYGQGTALGPEAIRLASLQIDFFERKTGRVLADQIYMLPINNAWADLNKKQKAMVEQYRKEPSESLRKMINENSEWLNKAVETQITQVLKMGKKPGLLGGDHSCPLGAIVAIGRTIPAFGILHIDAHHDLRQNYEGLRYSHASIMHQVLEQCPQVKKMVSLAIRDFSREEYDYAQNHPNIQTFYDSDLKDKLFRGQSMEAICQEIIGCLPDTYYISLDIDGLEPGSCPNTGTPVPGGWTFDQICFLLELLRSSGKQLIGFDLCEISPDLLNPENQWDGNVGARILHRLCSLLLTDNTRMVTVQRKIKHGTRS